MSFPEQTNSAASEKIPADGQASASIEKGQCITFGRYPRFSVREEADYYYEESYSEDNPFQVEWTRKNTFANLYYNIPSGFEPIEWLVLETDGKTALLISRHLILRRHFDACDYNAEAVHCEFASLELFLNENFMAVAFTDEEKRRIVPCKIRNEIYKKIGAHSDSDVVGIAEIDEEKFAVDSAIIKVEHIFSLSLKEALHYFQDDESRKCGLRNSAQGEESYWLRDFADLSGEEYSYGGIGMRLDNYKEGCGNGFVVDDFGALNLEPIHECIGVRPVMRITL
ncbi:MAG: DUF6273 domain-containing protein [bacterium]|nr:DUF6273 domain-containing protein [bacterium]